MSLNWFLLEPGVFWLTRARLVCIQQRSPLGVFSSFINNPLARCFKRTSSVMCDGYSWPHLGFEFPLLSSCVREREYWGVSSYHPEGAAENLAI